MDIERYFRKTYINLIPPPLRSLKKLPEEEIKEVTDYIFAHAKQTYRLIKEDAEKQNEDWKQNFYILLTATITLAIVLVAIIALLNWKLNIP